MQQRAGSRSSGKRARRKRSSPLKGRTQCQDDSCRRLAPRDGRFCDKHGLLREPAAVIKGQGIVGKTEPRLWTPPLRPLTRETTRGYEANEFAEMIGEPNLAWQQWLNIHALELNPDGTYRFRIVLCLVARQNGKSTSKRKVSLWRMYLDGARTILGTAQDVALAREQMNLAKATIVDSPDLKAEYGGERNVNGDEMFWLQGDAPRGTPREALPRYVIRATNRKAGRGLSIDELNIDELREQRDWLAWSALSKTVMARPYAQIWVLSNMGDDQAVVLNQLRAAAGVSIGSAGVSVLGPARDPSIGIFEWSGPEGCELDDWDAIAQANPGLNCGGPSAAAIRTALATDPPDVYRTEVLCQKVDVLDAAVDPTGWKACADTAGSMPRDNLIACVEVDEDQEHGTQHVTQHVTLGVGAQLPDGRVRVAIRKAWKSTAAARDELEAVLDELKPAAVAWFPAGPAAAFAPILRPADLVTKDGRKTSPSHRGREYVELTGLKVSEACMGLSDLAAARLILQPDDPLLNAHIGGAQKLPSGDGWRFVRRGVGHVDAAYAAAGVVYVALTKPPAKKPRIRVVA